MGRHRKDGEPTKHGNRYTAGTVARERVDRVVAFKPKIEVADALFADMEQRGMNATQWLDMAVEKVLGEGDSVASEVAGGLSSLVKDACATAIELKQAAIRAEKKNKRPDQALIQKWEEQIEQLERDISKLQ